MSTGFLNDIFLGFLIGFALGSIITSTLIGRR